LGMSRVLAEAGFPGWFERCREHGQELRACLSRLLGPERVLWSAHGFANNPFIDPTPEPMIFDRLGAVTDW
jgi:hypothetical protein